MNKFFIKNRKRQDISVIVEERNDLQKGSPSRSTSAAPQVVAKGDSRSPLSGLAFVMHGLGGFKEQKHIAAIAETFIEKSFTVVRFDAADTLGESGGKYEDATVTNYYQDLEDVIAWARTQLWYREPFALAGHSLGGMCVGLYAQKHPERVLAVAPVSPVVSGALSVQAHKRYEPED
ncbi:alpha/beta fold hydrolase, partial [Candidatus Azambacteria bacterium]|nr:alpha/beta fold hydrolase [Candidatus Azambacteria bacterium]